VVRKDQGIITEVHSAVKATLEQARTAKVLGSSLQSSVILEIEEGKAAAVLGRYLDELEDIFVVSSVQINQPLPDSPDWAYQQEFEILDAKFKVHVLPPKQEKCSRCWRYVAPVEDALCGRCDEVVGALPTSV
jgi:isoleucyl-tRNA synthetase